MPDDVDIEHILETAIAHHEAGRLDLAEADYRTVLQRDPNNPDALNLLGLVVLGRGDPDQSIALITRALDAQPDFPEALTNLALAQRTAGRPAMAVDTARRAIALDPDLAQAHLQLGAALIDLGDNAGAAEALRRANDMAPDSLEAQVALATALARLKDDPAAAGAYHPTPGQKPNDPGTPIDGPASPLRPERLEQAPAGQTGDADALHRLGVLRHRQGNSMQAVDLLARALAINPNDEAYRDLGMILTALGRFDAATDAYRHAIAINPADAGAHNSLANTLVHLDRLAEAEASFREALRLQPDFPDACNNLAAALRALGRPAEAEASCREALRLRPGFPQAYNNLGMTLNALDRPAEAEASFREALRLRRDFAGAHNGLGKTLLDLDRPAEAEASLREALRLRPNFPDACNNLGAALRELGRPAEAEASSREALRLKPDVPQAHNNLGMTLYMLDRPAEAEASFREALRLRPDIADTHNNLGNMLLDLGRPAEAEASYREALRLRPDFPGAHSNLALPLLLSGRFEEGWNEYEWRWKIKSMSDGVRGVSGPPWTGDAIGDRVILLHAEQGLGDTLQFCRYVPLVASAATTVLVVQAPLVRLLSRLPGITRTVAHGDPLPPFDLHCPLMSLPRAFGTTIDSIPATTPYLTADPEQAEAWAQLLSGLPGLRIGLVWAGGQHLDQPDSAVIDRRRSIRLNTMAPLAEVSGVSFISLQKGEPAAQSADPPRGMVLHDFTSDLNDFTDTAALIDGLDLVISVDTAVAHLAGALGKPVWVLNRFDTDWRWFLNRDDSPWYPTARLFRQPSPGDWDSVICAVRDALKRLAAGDRDQLRLRRA